MRVQAGAGFSLYRQWDGLIRSICAISDDTAELQDPNENAPTWLHSLDL